MIKSLSIIQRKYSFKTLSEQLIISYNYYADLLNIYEKYATETKNKKLMII